MNMRIALALAATATVLAACGKSEPQAPAIAPTQVAAVQTPPP